MWRARAPATEGPPGVARCVGSWLFKVENGQIRRIEAVFQRAPYGINSGWSTYEQGISEAPQIVR